MTKLRVRVIGIGWSGTVHYRAINDHPQLDSWALCDKSEERLSAMAPDIPIRHVMHPGLLSDALEAGELTAQIRARTAALRN